MYVHLYVFICIYKISISQAGMSVCLNGCPTSRVPTKDELPDLIVNKDEETVREGAEPPARPEKQTTEVI